MKFTVRRKSWLRGDYIRSQLRNETGSMCCLGFLGKACGVQNSDILGIKIPSFARNGSSKKYPPSIVHPYDNNGTELAREIMCVNDQRKLKMKDREQELKKLFKKGGITVTFK